MSGKGTLPDHEIVKLIEAGMLPGADPESAEAASLDLRISSEIYRVEGTFLPQNGETVREAMKKVCPTPHPIGTVMEVGVVYIAKLKEESGLRSSVYGYTNPKSTSGRLRVHVRLLVDGVSRYDSLPRNDGNRELWVSIIPQAMPVIMSEGEKLNQLRLFTEDTRFDEFNLEVSMARHSLLFDRDGKEIKYRDIKVSDEDGSVLLTLDLSLVEVGWESFGSARVLDMNKRDHYSPLGFFEPLVAKYESIKLRKGGFYILQSLEYVRVPPELACEMVPMDERSGDFRSHEAGFIDPGWGWNEDGSILGRPLTLELIPFEDLIFRHGQAVAKIRFEEMRSRPLSIYLDKKKGVTNYGGQQAPWLSKHFKQSCQIPAKLKRS